MEGTGKIISLPIDSKRVLFLVLCDHYPGSVKSDCQKKDHNHLLTYTGHIIQGEHDEDYLKTVPSRLSRPQRLYQTETGQDEGKEFWVSRAVSGSREMYKGNGWLEV